MKWIICSCLNMDICRKFNVSFVLAGIILLFHSPIYLSQERNSSWDSALQNNDLRNLNQGRAIYTALADTAIYPYSMWSKWSKCSKKCVTRRFRHCQIEEICGKKILRQRAYCFPRTKGNFCERWISEQNELLKYSSRQPTSSTNDFSEYLEQRKSKRLTEVAKPLPEYTAQSINCGFPLGKRKGRKSVLDMLKIIGGKTAKRAKWPWQVAVLNRFKEAYCGGTLISHLWVLTAAHCVRKNIYVRLGEYDLEVEDSYEMEFRIKKSIIHPKYNKQTVDNDIAILMLPESVDASRHAAFACLPQSYQPLPETRCTVIGWGKMNNDDESGSNVLKEAEVPIISTAECKNIYYDYTITKNMFCAGHRHGRIDTCAGDSGGPLLCRDASRTNQPWTIFGITSFGDGCGKQNKFGIYSKIPNYVDWIWSVINCNGNCIRNNKRKSKLF